MRDANNHSSPLRETLEERIGRSRVFSLDDFTVLSAQNDPFRLDTAAGHRDGQGLASMLEKLGIGKIHNRGIHYALLGQKKPNGLPYTGDDRKWLAGLIDARWLGYIDFESIVDERNLPPVIRLWTPSDPNAGIDCGNLPIPEIESEIQPSPVLRDMRGNQPYHLVIFGEKSSLSPILSGIADQFEADLYLPTGEISDTMLYQMAESGEADPRPMVVFTISDCDPSGWQMPISIARKLQAFKAAYFQDLEFQLRRVALLPSHVRKFQLPGSPLKETEKRADKWRQRIGLEQTEIDAMVTLHPDELREIVSESMASFSMRH